MKQILGKPKQGDIALAIVDLDAFLYKAAAQKFKYRVMAKAGVLSEPDSYTEAQRSIKEITQMGGVAWLDRQEDPQPLGHSLNKLNEMIGRVKDYLQAYEYHYIITGPNNFRDEVGKYREYKGNRKDREKPLNLADVKSYAIDRYNPSVSDGCEADDVAAQIQWTAYSRIMTGDYGWEDVTCVVSVDKDLRQCPGLNYNPSHKQLEWINEWDAEMFFYQQLLSGDSTDNVAGIPGIGEDRAAGILEGCLTVGEMDARVYRRYEEYLDKSDGEGWVDEYTPYSLMMEMGQLVRMQRSPGEMWEPLSKVHKRRSFADIRAKIKIGDK